MASLEVYQAMSAATSPSDMARVLPLAEKLLCQAGLMRATWAEHWQHSWQRATSYCVDWKHALLLTASLQVCAHATCKSLPGSLVTENISGAVVAQLLACLKCNCECSWQSISFCWELEQPAHPRDAGITDCTTAL